KVAVEFARSVHSESHACRSFSYRGSLSIGEHRISSKPRARLHKDRDPITRRITLRKGVFVAATDVLGEALLGSRQKIRKASATPASQAQPRRVRQHVGHCSGDLEEAVAIEAPPWRGALAGLPADHAAA